jgi:hypothetical protein
LTRHSLANSKSVAAATHAVALVSLVASLLALSACPGSLSSTITPDGGGSGGTTGGGTGGAASGVGGGGGAVATSCPNAISLLQNNCSLSCHNPGSDSSFANLDLMSDGFAQRLVGQPASTATSANGQCAGMGNLLNRGTLPATGIFIDKINFKLGVCGEGMPFGGVALAATDLACLQAWANGLVVSVGP